MTIRARKIIRENHHTHGALAFFRPQHFSGHYPKVKEAVGALGKEKM